MTIDGKYKQIYRTGDWAVRTNGRLYFSSRIDRQIKIRGHRLELGEIDAALRECGVTLACTVYVEGEIHSFVETNKEMDFEYLRDRILKILPDYACPSTIHALPSLPRNANDKIDSRALENTLKTDSAN